MKKESAADADRRNHRLGRIVRVPFRALRLVRDLYVRSLTGCAGNGKFRMAAGPAGVPRSYSLNPSRVSSGSEDFRELVRAASKGTMGSLNVGDFHQSAVQRSQSVAIGRIDEDKPYDFGVEAGLESSFYPRSRSCAIPSRKLGLAA